MTGFSKKTLTLKCEHKTFSQNGQPAVAYNQYTVEINGIPIILKPVPKDNTARTILERYFAEE